MDKIHSSIKRSLQTHGPNPILLSLGLSLLFVAVCLIFIYLDYYKDRFYPSTYIDDLDVAGMTLEEAKSKVQKNLGGKIDRSSGSLRLFYQDKEIKVNLSELGIQDNLDDTMSKAFAYGHQSRGLQRAGQIISSHLRPTHSYVKLVADQEAQNKIKSLIETFKQQIDLSAEKPSATIAGGQIEINPGKAGEEMSSEATWQAINQQILDRNLRDLDQNSLSIQAITIETNLVLNEAQIEASRLRAAKFIHQKLFLRFDYQRIEITSQELINLLSLPNGIDQINLANAINRIKQRVDRPSRDAVFSYDRDTLKVTEFTPDQAGLELDAEAVSKIISDFLTKVESEIQSDNTGKETIISDNTFDLPMRSAPASITLAQTNDLGINEVIGFGESWYAHSIPNRIYNVGITAARINNHIVKPGAEFSFNQALGEVSDRTGYRPAYVIEAGQTKLSPGGGVCQVSSTLFRTLLNAGLQVTRRLPHAYRVSYYEIGNEPGFDATVYSGDTDLRFINDTAKHILISCQSDSKDLYMYCKIYGTSDGRSTEIVNYRKWGATSPLPTVYIPDPSLRPGQLKQIDWSAAGIKTEFTNIVRDKNGNIMHEDYYPSSYRSWAAKYLRGV